MLFRSRLFVQADAGQPLMDKRQGRLGLVLGTMPDIAKQYGIKVIKRDDGFVFIGPTNRMQLLVEKMHFAGISYWEV